MTQAGSSQAGTIGRRLDALPVGRFHRRLLGLIAAGMFFDAFDIYIAGSVLGAMVKSGESDLAFNARFLSATFLGMMLGAWVSGVLGDRYGRRFSYQLNLLLYGVASLAGALAPSVGWLIALRFVMGLGMGAEIVVGYATLSEFIPARSRGRFGTVLNLIINTSLFLSTLLGWMLIPRFGWRPMFAIAGVGALVVWVLRKSMPESPRWLEQRGRVAEADRLLRAIEAECGVASPTGMTAEASAPAAPGRWQDLFAPELRLRTAVGVTVSVGLFIVNYAFVSWVPTFLVKAGYDVSGSLGLTTLMFAGGPLGSLTGFALSERIGRKWGIVACSLAGLVLAALFAAAHASAALTVIGFGMTWVIYVLSSLSVAVYVPELFPTALRLRGTGLSNTVGRAVSIVFPYGVAAAFASGGLPGVMAIMGATYLVQAVIVGTIGTETRQRALEDVGAEAVAHGWLDTAMPDADR